MIRTRIWEEGVKWFPVGGDKEQERIFTIAFDT